MSGPGSNDWASATIIALGDTSDATPATTLTLESGEPIPDGYEGFWFRTAWWQWTPDTTGWYELDTSGSGTEVGAVIQAFFHASSLDALSFVAMADSGGTGWTSLLKMYAYAGQRYDIQVGMWEDDPDDEYVLEIREGAQPVVDWSKMENGNSPPMTLPLGSMTRLSASLVTAPAFSDMGSATLAPAGAGDGPLFRTTSQGTHWWQVEWPEDGIMMVQNLSVVTGSGTRVAGVFDADLEFVTAEETGVQMFVPVVAGQTYWVFVSRLGGDGLYPGVSLNFRAIDLAEDVIELPVTIVRKEINEEFPVIGDGVSGALAERDGGPYLTMYGTEHPTPFGALWFTDEWDQLDPGWIGPSAVADIQMVERYDSAIADAGGDMLGNGPVLFYEDNSGTASNRSNSAQAYGGGGWADRFTSFRTGSNVLTVDLEQLETGLVQAGGGGIAHVSISNEPSTTQVLLDYFAVRVLRYPLGFPPPTTSFAVKPILRITPREDGRGASTTPRVWPRPRSQQASNRATGYL